MSIPAHTQPLLSVRQLRTHLLLEQGTVKAVDDLSFDIYPGQIVGIVGESGCGKSMTSKSILRLADPPAQIVGGEILWRSQRAAGAAGEPIDLVKLAPDGKQMRALRGAGMALIPQEPMAAFSPVHTIGNQLIEAIRLHQPLSQRAARQRAIELLGSVGVPAPEQRIDAYAWELSGGLRQRVMIALALSCGPELLIADEPTTAIDATTQAQVLTLLRSIQRRNNMAVMLITHDLGVIAQIADFVVVMYLGRAVEKAPVDTLFHAPKHPYTQALLRSVPGVHLTPRTRLSSITGAIPPPFSRPAGCPFHPRCPAFMPGVCDQRVPELRLLGEQQQAACFRYEDGA